MLKGIKPLKTGTRQIYLKNMKRLVSATHFFQIDWTSTTRIVYYPWDDFPVFYIFINKTMNEISELQRYFCPYGYLDLQAICRIGDDL